MYSILLIVHVVIAVVLVGLVLIQHGKGADAGAAFGSGASGTVFGSRGSSSFLTRTTGLLAASFFVTSLTLAIMAGTFVGGGESIMQGFEDEPTAPAEPDERGPAPDGAADTGEPEAPPAPAPED